MKYPEQVKFLANNKVSIAVGTPARVAKLLSEGEYTFAHISSVLA
jgi:hypothetical protein